MRPPVVEREPSNLKPTAAGRTKGQELRQALSFSGNIFPRGASGQVCSVRGINWNWALIPGEQAPNGLKTYYTVKEIPAGKRE